MVEQRVIIERCHPYGVALANNDITRRLRSAAGVDPAAHDNEQDWIGKFGVRVDAIQLAWLRYRGHWFQT